jgi:glycerate kinase
MKVAVAIQEWPSTGGARASAAEAAQAVKEQWEIAAPHCEVVAAGVGDGGPRTADAWSTPGVPAGGAIGVATDSGLVLAPAAGASRWNPTALATALLGIAADAGHENRRQTVIVPVGDEPPAGNATDLWGGGLAAMRAALAPLTIIALVGHSRPLLGFHGMSAASRDGRENDSAIALAAQEQEQRWSDIARDADAIAGRTTLLGPTRLSDAPSSGAAGGLAYCLGAAGAQLTPASAYLLDAIDFGAMCADADLVVAVAGELTPSALDNGVAGPVAAAAAARGVPCVVITPALHVGKRDLMAAGISSAYEAVAGIEGLRDRIVRVAQTWTPTR